MLPGYGLRPGFAIVFSGLTVLGKVQVPMPINYGQQGCRQPIFQVFINGEALQGFADPMPPKADRNRQRFYLVTELFHHVFVVANVLFTR